MKQRLLLALLMLLTSAGFMKVDGQTIVLPKSETGEKVTLTFTGKFSASSYPIVYGTAKTSGNEVKIVGTPGTTAVYELASSVKQDTTYVLNNAYLTDWGEIGVTLDGKVLKFETSSNSNQISPKFSSLVFLNNDTLISLNLEQASGLKKLDISGNDDLTSINNLHVTTELVTLEASDCGFKKLPDISTFSKLKTLNVSKNQLSGFSGALPASLETVDFSYNELAISTIWDLSTLVNLKSLNVDGNRLKGVKVADAVKDALNFGIQDFTKPAYTGCVANKNLDLNDVCKNNITGSISIKSAESWMKYNDKTQKYDIDAASEARKIIENNGVIYRFFDDKNVYVDGNYECVLVSEEGFKYRVHIEVKPASVNLTRAALAHGVIKAYNDGGVEVFQKYALNGNVVPNAKQGQNLKIEVDFADATDYELSTFVLKGLEIIDGDLTKTPIKCRIAAKYVSEAALDEEPSIDAEIVGKDCEISYNSPVSDKGYFKVYTKDAEGKYTIEVPNNTKVAFGTEIRVVLSPKDPKYVPTLVINNKKLELKSLEQNGQQYADYTVEADKVVITASFEDKKDDITVGVQLNGNRLDAASGLPFSGLNVTIKGSGDKDVTINSSTPTASLKPNGAYQLETQIAKSNKHYIKHILVDGTALNIKHTVSGDNDLYRADFTTPSVDTEIYFVVAPLVDDWSVIPTKLDASVTTSNSQVEMYDGGEKAFAFETNPAGLEKFVTVKYESNGDVTADAPKSVGTYKVHLVPNTELSKTAEMAGYFPLVERVYSLSIKAIKPAFKQVPVVTIVNGQYEITGENEDGVDGVYAMETSGVNTTSSHVVKFKFTPTDNTNYTEVHFVQEVQVANSKSVVKKQPVKISADAGLTIRQVMNADAVPCAVTGGTFVEGSVVYIYVEYPKGVDPTKIKATPTYNKGTLEKCVDQNSSNVLVYKYTVPQDNEGQELVFSIESDAQLKKEYSIELTPKAACYTKPYTGSPLKLADFGATLTVKKDDMTPIEDYSIAFRLSGEEISGFPVNVGVYDLIVTVPANDQHKEKIQEYKGCVEITEATPTIAKWPTALPILKNDNLGLAFLSGGRSEFVPGSFQWAEDVKGQVPEDGKEYEVWFVPADLTNYLPVKTGKAKVTVLDITVPVLRVETPLYGTITVADSETGAQYTSGKDLTGVKGLVITATPSQYFTFSKLIVNGNASTTQTVNLPLDGKTSVTISAEFKHIEEEPEIDENSRYTVNVTKVLRGAVIDKPGANSVKRGESFSFSVATLAADASKVVVKVDGVTIKPVSGKYTITNITENKEVSVTLANPTPIKVTVPTEYKNKGGYLMGRVKISGPSDGKYYYNDQITLVAFPESNVHFDGWTGDLTGLTQIKEVVLTKDLTAGAKFSGTPTGIEDIMAASITTGKGCVWVRGIANADVTIVSIAGRVQAQERISGDTRIDVPAGIYVVVLESGSDVKRVKVIVK